MQNHYNLLYREEEREMNRFCNSTGVGLIPVCLTFLLDSPRSNTIYTVGSTLSRPSRAPRQRLWHNRPF